MIHTAVPHRPVKKVVSDVLTDFGKRGHLIFVFEGNLEQQAAGPLYFTSVRVLDDAKLLRKRPVRPCCVSSSRCISRLNPERLDQKARRGVNICHIHKFLPSTPGFGPERVCVLRGCTWPMKPRHIHSGREMLNLGDKLERSTARS